MPRKATIRADDHRVPKNGGFGRLAKAGRFCLANHVATESAGFQLIMYHHLQERSPCLCCPADLDRGPCAARSMRATCAGVRLGA
jgi:hypothetical protein